MYPSMHWGRHLLGQIPPPPTWADIPQADTPYGLTPPGRHPSSPTATAADCTHPTGMCSYLSCSCRRQLPRLSTKKEIIGNVVVTLLTVGFNSCLFASVKFAPLGTVGCLYRTAVMVFCMILSRIIMKEKITIPKVGVYVC